MIRPAHQPKLHPWLAAALQHAADRRPASRWFDVRVQSHIAPMGQPQPPQVGAAALADALGRPPSVDYRRVVYVHIPYCKHICTFCAFFRTAAGQGEYQAYTDALVGQIAQLAESPWVQARPFDAVFLGGGTPTSLSADQLAAVITALHQLPLRDDCEFTVEARFDGVDGDYLHTLRSAGANRVSFGVQSFDTVLRQSVGRLADQARVLDTLAAAGRAGFDNISTDLIYNLPDQSLESWRGDLRTLADSPATACSVYALIPYPKSALGRRLETGDAPPLGDIDHQLAMHTAAHEQLSARPGWRRFSSVHFGRADRERNRYNAARAGETDVLAIGAGAGGRIGPLTYFNVPDIRGYIASQAAGQPAPAHVARIDDAAMPKLDVFALLDAGGIAAAHLLDLLPEWQANLDALLALQLVQQHHEHLRLTDLGCFWAYNIGSMLSDSLNATGTSHPAAHPHPVHPAHPGHRHQHH